MTGAALLAAIAERHQAPPDTAASYLLGWSTLGVATPAAAALLTQRRVPDLSPASVSVHLDDDYRVERVTFGGPATAVLPGDPLAGAAHVITLADHDALRHHLAAALLTHLAPLVEAVRQRSRLGPRVRWGRVADSIGAAFLEVGHAIGDQQAARAEADALFAVAAPVLRARPAWVPIQRDGVCHLYLRRGVCCLAYKTPHHGYCTSCPCLADAEREHRLHDALDG